MRSREGSVLDTLLRVQAFLDANAGQLGSISTSGARKMLDDSISALSGHAVNQGAGLRIAKGATEKAQTLRTALREGHMRPISAIARAKLRAVPEFASLGLPRANTSDPALVMEAGSMADAAQKYASVFVDAGLPEDFIAQLLAARDAFAGTRVARDESRGRRSSGTKGLQTAAQAGRQALRVLDSFVVPALGTADHLVAEWKSLSRVKKERTRAAGAGQQVPGTGSQSPSTGQGATGQGTTGQAAPGTPGTPATQQDMQQQGAHDSPSSPTAPATPVASSAGESTTTSAAVSGPVAQAA